MDRFFFLSGVVAALIGVALGAFGAHSLRTKLSPEMLGIFEVGVRYQMYHAFGLIAVACRFISSHSFKSPVCLTTRNRLLKSGSKIHNP